MSLIPTASQTVGPFFNFALTANPSLGILARAGARGERIRLAFRVIDGDGAPTPGDALIELWQADARGRYGHALDPRSGDADPNFHGFGRLETDAHGECVFETVKPGPVSDGGGAAQAPHINVTVLARGLLKPLYTRVYFAGEPANAHDAVLALVPEPRRATLLARPVAGQPDTWSLEIRLQGEAETVFFDV
ncbi:MAG: protocatechuate 3,4-dioxygenase subunit alpha [Acidobacteriia bacterium]|nr:protocatechuate 3,4-dioxygenase subunit alpha [Terriglobia bacterium]